jgi:hypothetical protein
MKLTERDREVLAAFTRGLRYQAAADALGLDKNKIYSSTTKLLKLGLIRKISVGKYETCDSTAPPILSLVPVQKKKEPAPAPTPPPAPAIEIEIDTLGGQLIDKVADLRPLLMLHKDLFADIERITLALIEQALDLKKRALTDAQWQEYLDLLETKKRAIQIARSFKLNQPAVEKRK